MCHFSNPTGALGGRCFDCSFINRGKREKNIFYFALLKCMILTQLFILEAFIKVTNDFVTLPEKSKFSYFSVMLCSQNLSLEQ